MAMKELALSNASALDGEIRDGQHFQPVRVYYEDTDFSGVVYHASYLRFMERGRTNYLRLLGADQRAMFEEVAKEAPGFAFVVRAMQLDFRKPARMDDLLEVITTPQEVKGASIVLHQLVNRGAETPTVDPDQLVSIVRDGAWQTLLVLLLTAAAAALGGVVGARPELRMAWSRVVVVRPRV